MQETPWQSVRPPELEQLQAGQTAVQETPWWSVRPPELEERPVGQTAAQETPWRTATPPEFEKPPAGQEERPPPRPPDGKPSPSTYDPPPPEGELPLPGKPEDERGDPDRQSPFRSASISRRVERAAARSQQPQERPGQRDEEVSPSPSVPPPDSLEGVPGDSDGCSECGNGTAVNPAEKQAIEGVPPPLEREWLQTRAQSTLTCCGERRQPPPASALQESVLLASSVGELPMMRRGVASLSGRKKLPIRVPKPPILPEGATLLPEPGQAPRGRRQSRHRGSSVRRSD